MHHHSHGHHHSHCKEDCVKNFCDSFRRESKSYVKGFLCFSLGFGTHLLGLIRLIQLCCLTVMVLKITVQLIVDDQYFAFIFTIFLTLVLLGVFFVSSFCYLRMLFDNTGETRSIYAEMFIRSNSIIALYAIITTTIVEIILLFRLFDGIGIAGVILNLFGMVLLVAFWYLLFLWLIYCSQVAYSYKYEYYAYSSESLLSKIDNVDV